MNYSLENLYEETEARSKLLEKTILLRDQWKQCGDDLLYSMLPQSVADRLRAGANPIDTCQVFSPFL